MKDFIKRVRKSFRCREKGFTLIELLIVIAVLGALAAVVVPAVGSFLTTANLTAANTEAANVKTAAMSYLADNGDFPATSDDLMGVVDYISSPPDGTYTFDTKETGNGTGMITAATPGDGITEDFMWEKTAGSQSWER